jgi:hypothetical protein
MNLFQYITWVFCLIRLFFLSLCNIFSFTKLFFINKIVCVELEATVLLGRLFYNWIARIDYMHAATLATSSFPANICDALMQCGVRIAHTRIHLGHGVTLAYINEQRKFRPWGLPVSLATKSGSLRGATLNCTQPPQFSTQDLISAIASTKTPCKFLRWVTPSAITRPGSWNCVKHYVCYSPCFI